MFRQVWDKLRDSKPAFFCLEVIVMYSAMVTTANHLISPTICIGPSMIPTINPKGEVALVDVYSYKYDGKVYERGDVVIARSKEGKKICKRIRALEGDIVYNRVSPTRIEKVVLKKGEAWLQGDNPSNSMDSRMYGPIQISSIEGKVFMKWDFSEMIVEPLSNEFIYRSIEDERSDTKILRGGACLENGNFVDCHDISDLQLPRGEFPDPTIILKQVLGVSDSKIIAIAK